MMDAIDLAAANAAANAKSSARNLRASIVRCLKYGLGKDAAHASLQDWRIALSLALRERVVDPWLASTRQARAEGRKRVYYLSMEFLIGRLLEDAALNLGLEEEARMAMESLGLDYGAVVADEPDAALGNGGLGRLAACFLDSLATLGIPAFGYGIRYEHGLFRQVFVSGEQREEPEDWLSRRHPWEFERPEAACEIGFGGSVRIEDGKTVWHPEQTIRALPYDTPVIGWRGRWANTLRLWSARPSSIFDLDRFQRGEFLRATEREAAARSVSRVLYPDDSTPEGRELRLKQEYFFTAASIQDVVKRFLSEHGSLESLPSKAAIQLNDTHPAIAVPELIRILVDNHGIGMETAIRTARGCLSYTNHTLMPEALERWPEALLARLLPRHHQIICHLDDWQADAAQGPHDAVRIVENGDVKMGELAFIGSHRVNGVSALHTDLVRRTVFAGLSRLHPERIVNQTNGVTLRRWLHGCNPALRSLIAETAGPDWPADPGSLERLAPRLGDPDFLSQFAEAKQENKRRLAAWLAGAYAIPVDPEAMFDVQIKRVHEYKRQLMNLLEAVALWNAMRDKPGEAWTPRVKIFAGKAAPGYRVAKQIIRLIHDTAAVINADPATRDWLQIIFPPDYNVSMAERVIPAADLSEQISTAGTEASGTGNMKLALNGAITIGTLDGANIEIRERVGHGNFFRFGLTASAAAARLAEPGFSRRAIEASPALSRVLGQIAGGLFSPGERDRHVGLVSALYEDDRFLVTCDFDSYFETQRQADRTFRDRATWTRMAAANTAMSGWFASDRTVAGYARDIWIIPLGATSMAAPSLLGQDR